MRAKVRIEGCYFPFLCFPFSHKAYLYGTVFVLLVTLSAALGILIFPWVKGHKKELMLNSLVALAVSTLVSEALLHLIPSVSIVIK